MSDLANEVVPVNIEDELKNSYLDYAMSVIIGRALPDVRDGLKPVHRRVLFAMNVLGNDFNKPYKKSARLVGDVIGKYHPHGDSAVYDTIVRMAQPFSLRYMLADGQGNFGSVDGDSAAAMRYTEVRMSKIAHQLLADLEKETVDFVPNYDGTEQIPDVLPTRIPNLLANGSSGIAVGMATNIPPHNLNEVIDGCLAMIDKPDITLPELMEYIPGPDFPTAGILSGRQGIIDAYTTGRGIIYIRARAEVEVDEKSGRETIIVHELPYQVNKAKLIEKIAELVKDKKIEGISALRDESDKDGMRIVIEMRRGESGDIMLNQLYRNTQMQVSFGMNMVALDKGQPKLFSLPEILEAFITHRREVVTRRTVYELRRARERAHTLEGLAIALANINEIIELIKASPTPVEAKAQLMERGWALGNVATMLERAGVDAARPEWVEDDYGIINSNEYRLTEVQAQAILDLRLHRLTGLEHEKILAEYQNLLNTIEELLYILNNAERLMEVIREELEEVKAEFGDDRRTEITSASHDINMEDLIDREDVVVTLSHEGYVKYQPLTEYEAQRRGGRGKAATRMKDEDFIERLLVANTHDNILCFSSAGRVYWMKTYQLPYASRTARGRPIVNLLPLETDERITAILPISDFVDDKFIIMATRHGTIKKTPLVDYSRPRSSGIIALNLVEGDELIGVDITDGSDEVMMFSDAGKAVRFHEDKVRSMGRTATGVRGMRLDEGERIVSLIIPRGVEAVETEESDQVVAESAILTVTENGYGKRTLLSEYPMKNRATKGVISIKVSERNGSVVGALEVVEGEHLMLISNRGTLVRTRVDEVSQVGRNTQGVTLIRTIEEEVVVGVARIAEIDEDDALLDPEGVEAEQETSLDEAAADTDAPEADDASDDLTED
ncbi:DNA topoisomerase (ATP-hydrolyzing) subunit A [Aliidiomarina quisquiliarum]|uniref:DNA topoisomerase (ATP-hydrolyzing) subunit A n=1 Tax=Aliidiomarina quisquiliarum TaxID=2938947 RepID=UPI00208F0E23|nr:DNA topoisomerase (ATP-hydrolyzing) subunit A [Aliidiomarina quisquiliarum]MCO4320861.1 DNA topoisomerase (ATP-hydrolyzing) subunit A [Aliidiomarina quisquiliarum]